MPTAKMRNPEPTKGGASKTKVLPPAIAYGTRLGHCFQGRAEAVLASHLTAAFQGQVDLIFTSPPFPLNRKKKYDNFQGREYVRWLKTLAPVFCKFLKPTGSIVIEVGNSWEPGKPIMSTLALESLLAFRRAGKLNLCQQFIWYNPARLPAPAQWVTVERIRLKDAYTHLWWMSPSERPKADNRKVLSPYSDSMKKLLRTKHYNAGRRPSEYKIGETSFLKNNRGAIPPNLLQMPLESDVGAIVPPNVVTMANTHSVGDYPDHCRENDIEPHPARMPSGLAEFFISFLTDPDDLVMDPFGGSNTTGAAAEHLGRRWLTIEANPEYIRGSKGRFPQLTKTNRANGHPARKPVGTPP